MYSIDLTKEWCLTEAYAQESVCSPMPKGRSIDLPYDAMTKSARSFDIEGGAFNGYYAPSTVTLYKALPSLGQSLHTYLDVWGAGGEAEFFLNGEFVGRATDSGHFLFEITDKLSKKGTNVLKCVAASQMSGRYSGLGLGGACIYTSESPIFIDPKGVYIATTEIDKKAHLTAYIRVVNTADEAQTAVLYGEVLNHRGKRVVKKMRKIKIKSNSNKVFELKLRMSRHYDWSTYDPYLYDLKVLLLEALNEGAENEPKELDAHTDSFGIRTFEFDGSALRLNGTPVMLKGAVMPHDNSILGSASELSTELYKLGKIKELGFNAVRYIGCPSDNALKAMDTLGLMCVVDIFNTFAIGSFINDGHENFERDYKDIINRSIQTLQNHPSVVIYSAVNNAPESYGRGGGYEVLERVVNQIKENDKYRPITANAIERPLIRAEAEKFSIRCTSDSAVLKGAEDKNVFKVLTEPYFEKVDFASYGNLYKRFAIDSDRMILGLATPVENLSEAFDEADKNDNVLGNFVEYGADFIGNTLKSAGGEPHICGDGLLDKAFNPKKSAVYARTILDRKFTASIWVMDPAELEENPQAEPSFESMISSWNWNAYIGKPIIVRVYSNTEVISLKLDDKVISRKMAGKFNNYFAEFKLNYYPGRLEAIGFYKGAEVTSAVLETTTQARALKLEPSVRRMNENELCFINVSVKDKEGRLLSCIPAHDVKLTVEGEGELIGFTNGDNYSFSPTNCDTQSLFEGRATAIVRAKATGKIVVKVTGDGILSNKTRIKVK